MKIPDENPNSILDIDFLGLYSKGYRGIMVDVDNTVATYFKHKISDDVRELFRRLHKLGYRTVILSNNKNEEMVAAVAKDLESSYVFDSQKPHREGFMKALDLLGAAKEQTMIIGDEYHADGIGGKNFGIYTILVEPINATSDFLWMGWDRALAVIPKIITRKSRKKASRTGFIRVDISDIQQHLQELYRTCGSQQFNEAITAYHTSLSDSMGTLPFEVRETCVEEDISVLISKYDLTDLESLGKFLNIFIENQPQDTINVIIGSIDSTSKKELKKYQESLPHKLIKIADSKALGALWKTADNNVFSKTIEGVITGLAHNKGFSWLASALIKKILEEGGAEKIDEGVIRLIIRMEEHDYLKFHHRYINAYKAPNLELQRAQQQFCDHKDSRAYKIFTLSVYDSLPGVNYLRALCMLNGKGCEKDVGGAVRLLESNVEASMACRSLLARCYIEGKVDGVPEYDRAFELAADVLSRKDMPESDVDGTGEYLYDLAYFCGIYAQENLGDIEKAKDYLHMSIRMRPYRKAYNELGLIYASEGNSMKAKECFMRAEKRGLPAGTAGRKNKEHPFSVK